MSLNKTLWIGNDNDLHLDALTDDRDASFINDATVTAEVKNEAGDVVTNGGSITLGYIASSDGNYVGAVPDNAAINDGSDSGDGPNYFVEITAVSSSRTGFWRIPCIAKYRS